MSSGHASTRPRILIADDDPDILELVAFRLSRAGFDVMKAADGEDALAKIAQHGPDLAVLDVMMPKVDGYEATRRIRASAVTGHIPVILLTARVQDVDIARGFDAGADDYMKKPFSPHELRARVEAVLGRSAGAGTPVSR
jgi:DNA-binding response OmpR family regulator